MTLSFENLKETQGRFEIKIKSPDLKKACKELERFFKKEYDQEELDDCYVCGYLSPEEDLDGNLIENCPYCGVEFDYGEEDEEEYEEHDEEETEVLDALSVDNLEDNEEDEEELDNNPLEDSEDETEKETEEAKEEEIKSSDEDNSNLKEVVERVTKKKEFKVAKKKGSNKKEKLPVVHEEEVVGLSLNQEKELQEAIERIKNIKTDIVENIYNIGLGLNDIHDKMLWKARATNFNKFCEDHLDISRSSVYKYMACVNKFTKEQFINLGIKKADLISRLPEGKREEVAEHVIENNLTAEATKNLIKEERSLPKEKNEKREKEKEEVKNIKEDTTTLLAKIKQDNELEVPWVLFDGESLVEERSSEDKYAIVNISDEVELIVIENEFGTGLICSFRNKK